MYFIDPDDQDYKEPLTNARRNLERRVAPALPGKRMVHTGTTKVAANQALHPKRLPKRFLVEKWNLMNPQGNERNLLYLQNTKTILQVKDLLRCLVTIWYTSSFKCHKQRKYQVQRLQWVKEMGGVRELVSVEIG